MNIGAECRSNEMVITILFVSLKGSATLGTLGFGKTDGWAKRQSQPVEHIVCNFYVSQPVEKMS